MKQMRLLGFIAMVAGGLMALTASAAAPPSPWEQPAAALAEQIANLLGPGQARLTIRNLSTIPTDDIPAIRRLLEQDLKTHGVLASGAESANTLRVTLGENARERLWVAEVIQGNETRVAMARVDLKAAEPLPAQAGMALHSKRVWNTTELAAGSSSSINGAVLAAIETNGALAILTQDSILLSIPSSAGPVNKRFPLERHLVQSRDPRGLLLPSADGNGFLAFIAGTECRGSFALPADNAAPVEDGWLVHCHESDDPWPILNAASITIGAFYNAARNYFTGVVTPSLDVDLPPFYSAALLPRPASNAALLVGGIDGKVQLAENSTLKPVAGARDWGSDFAALHSGCGAGTQIVASGSGEAASDSLRAYELPAQEAIPVSAALAMDGTVTALWTAPDGKSVLAVVRGAGDRYEVDRVTASCNE